MKILILGGYGNFGARVCRALSHDPAIELVVCGRDGQRAAAFAQELGAGARALALDITRPDLAQALQAAGAELVLHTAGPFQNQRYDVALAAAQAGAHYIDLADARRFVCDFAAQTDAAFRAAGRLAISGASTVPALSSAVIASLTAGWRRIDSIDCCIAPAQTAPRGVATMAAVLDYCGAPIQVWRDGAWSTQYGWAAPSMVRFARLRPRLGALCDIPDLELFPARYPGVRSVMFRAALEIGLSQRVFALLATLRRAGWLVRPQRLADLLNRVAARFDWMGSSLGGMVLRVSGLDAHGKPVMRAWHIAADHDHGPEIPAMAALLLARKLARGQINDIGASDAAGCLTLDEFAPEFAKWGMQTDVVDEAVGT